MDATTNFGEHSRLVVQRNQRLVYIAGGDRVIGGSDCGFGTNVGFVAVDLQTAYAKLEAMPEGAKLIS
nr:hypothetical protein [Sulfitobacter sp. F26169L]